MIKKLVIIISISKLVSSQKDNDNFGLNNTFKFSGADLCNGFNVCTEVHSLKVNMRTIASYMKDIRAESKKLKKDMKQVAELKIELEKIKQINIDKKLKDLKKILTDLEKKNFKDGKPGPAGRKGDMGRKGDRGIGSRGSIGPRGPQGVTGSRGLKGSTGSNGQSGPQGAKGLTGETGKVGSKGEIGQKGDKGTVRLKLIVRLLQFGDIWKFSE